MHNSLFVCFSCLHASCLLCFFCLLALLACVLGILATAWYEIPYVYHAINTYSSSSFGPQYNAPPFFGSCSCCCWDWHAYDLMGGCFTREGEGAYCRFMTVNTTPDGVYHTPLGRFPMLDISTVGTVSSVKKVDVRHLPISESFRKTHVSFGIGTLLVLEQSSLENRPRGPGVRDIRVGYRNSKSFGTIT